ncbi:MAG: alkaline phosphatase family protein [Bacteroidetes bacterium]|nr:alkaline phosphatase family protein [Bacteroidota bacterium]
MKGKIILVLSLLQFATRSFAQQPKLVVGIVVDQMRYDYLYRFAEKYSDGGFKRLMRDGFLCKNAQYNYIPTYTGPGHASIYTGTTPAIHGIAANEWYNKKTKTETYCTQDKTAVPVGSTGSAGFMSPKNLEASTIGDELEIFTNQQAKVIGLSLKDRSSILPAGHAADAAYWFDGSTGTFITSTFYKKELPQWLVDFNAKKYAQQYLEKGWNTLLPITQYTESLSDDNPYEKAPNKKEKPIFPYEYSQSLQKKEYDIIRTTPMGNTLTKQLAIAAIEGENMGTDAVCDLLCVSFSSTDYIGHSFAPKSIEVEDAYIQLDKDLEDFLLYLDTKIGKDQYTVFLTADHGASENVLYLQSKKIPAGIVNKKEIEKKIKGALYQAFSDSLVLKYVNQQVYLNDSIIYAKHMDKFLIEKHCAQVLRSIPEVQDVFCSEQLFLQTQNDMLQKALAQRGFNGQRSGDVLVVYKPGFVEYGATGTTHGSSYSYDTHVPLLFFGNGIVKGHSTRSIFITDIASTICQLLNIPYPNGNIGTPIGEALK